MSNRIRGPSTLPSQLTGGLHHQGAGIQSVRHLTILSYDLPQQKVQISPAVSPIAWSLWICLGNEGVGCE